MRYLRALALLAFVAASVGAQTPHAVVAHVLGEPGWIGIVPDSTDPLIIRRVIEGTPANRNGLRPGDRIVEIDGKPASAEVLYHHSFKVTATVRLRIMRGTERLDVLSMPIVENPYYASARRDSVTRASAVFVEELLSGIRANPERYYRMGVGRPTMVFDSLTGNTDMTWVVTEQRTAVREVEAALAQLQGLQEQQRVMVLQVELLRAQSVNRQAEQNLINRKTQMADEVAALQRQLREIAGKTQQDLARVSQHVAQAADSVRLNKVADRIRYSAQLLRETDPVYSRATEKQIASDLEAAAQELRRAAEQLSLRQSTDSILYRQFSALGRPEPNPSPTQYIKNREVYDQLTATFRDMDQLARRFATSQRLLSGAELEQLNPALGEYFGGVSQGVFVLRTTDGTPAVAAGLRAGDILESVNGRRVTTVDELLAAVSQQTGPINLAIVRRGQRSTITLRR